MENHQLGRPRKKISRSNQKLNQGVNLIGSIIKTKNGKFY